MSPAAPITFVPLDGRVLGEWYVRRVRSGGDAVEIRHARTRVHRWFRRPRTGDRLYRATDGASEVLTLAGPAPAEEEVSTG